MEKTNELNDVRKLATIARIRDIQPIEGAENIEKIFVRGWQCVAKKGEYQIGDLCIYVEIDSIMPDGLPEEKREEWRALNKQMSKASEEEMDLIRYQMVEITKLNTRPEFEFLRSVKFHIKTRKIFGEISQGICFPLSILQTGESILNNKMSLSDIVEGLDVTEILGVTQYIAPDPATLGGDEKGKLTNVGILVTDEERIENLQNKYEKLREFRYYKTEKLEGTSVTYYLKNGVFGVSGRTIDFKIPDEDIPFDKLNVYWKVAKKYHIEQKMRDFASVNNMDNFAIQGEIVGESIQKNIYKLRGQQACFYNAFDIEVQEYFDYDIFLDLIKSMGLQTVPVLDTDYKLPEHFEDLLKEADETKTVFGNNPDQLIEGFVYVAKGRLHPLTKITRSDYGRLSFKAKSRTYDMRKK